MPTITCPCGRTRKVKPAELRRGARYCSWGCMYKYSHKVKHGLARHPLYSFWKAMVERCHSPNSQSFPRYGGRGITVCDEWRHDPRPFVAWVENNLGGRPTPTHTLDRIDNDQGYHPGNLRWATKSQQTINQRKARSNSGVRGIHKTKNGTYRAMLYRDNKDIYVGTFPTLDAAASALASRRDEYDGRR